MTFSASTPLRAQCTDAKTGRSITIGHHEARLAAARTRQTAPTPPQRPTTPQTPHPRGDGSRPGHPRPTAAVSHQLPSSALLSRVVEWAVADVARAGHDDEKALQEPDNGVEGQAGAAAFGSRRSRVQKAWASTVRVTWRC